MEGQPESRAVPPVTNTTSSVLQRLSASSVMSGVHYQHLVAGLTAGVAATLVMHPFDLIKLRFAGEQHYTAILVQRLLTVLYGELLL